MKLEYILSGIIALAFIWVAIIVLTGGNEKKEITTYPMYKEIQKPSGYVNSEPFTLKQYVGEKVILLDIMTYSCINCQRTFPYVEGWYEKYKDQGLIVIGVHTPEFAFEKDIKNVEEAMKRFGLTFPVVLDNDYATWNAYGNRYWPRKYLIDIHGNIVYDHIGEGDYKETEEAIQKALKERAEEKGIEFTLTEVEETKKTVNHADTPEVYFGAWRNTLLANGEQGVVGVESYTPPEEKRLNNVYLGGTWNIQKEYAEAQEDAQVILKYRAKDVYAVLGGEGVIEVYQDGKKVKDIAVSSEKLYTLISDETQGEHLLELRLSPDVELFTFTFG